MAERPSFSVGKRTRGEKATDAIAKAIMAMGEDPREAYRLAQKFGTPIGLAGDVAMSLPDAINRRLENIDVALRNRQTPSLKESALGTADILLSAGDLGPALAAVGAGVKGAKASKAVKKVTKNTFEEMSQRGKMRTDAHNDKANIKLVAKGQKPATDISIDFDDPKGDALAQSLTKRGLVVVEHPNDPSRAIVAKTAEDAERLKNADTNYAFGKAYGYSDDDIARFYNERFGPDAFREWSLDRADWLKKTKPSSSNKAVKVSPQAKAADEAIARMEARFAANPSATLRGAPSEFMVSTRRPSAPNYAVYGNPDEELILQSGEAMRLTPEGFAKNMEQLAEAPFLADMAGASPDEIYEAGVRRGADNLKFIVEELMTPQKATEAMEWYPTAHILGKDYAARINKPDAAGWGALAVTSPQTPWPVNVARVDRMTQMLADKFMVDPAGFKRWAARREAMRPEQRGAVYSQGMPYMERVMETPFDELGTDMDRYARIVLADASRFPSDVPNVTPKGEFFGKFGPMTWGTSREIGSALRIMDDPSMANIRRELTGGGKVPSFFNDIATPYTGLPTATMDTHSTGAFSLFPGGGKDPIVYRGMGLGAPKGLPPAAYSSTATGAKGLYGAMVDAHALAAKELGLDRVNAVQSMTWEGVRDLWGDSAKTPALKKAIAEIQRTSRTPEEMRFRVAELLGKPVKRSFKVKK